MNQYTGQNRKTATGRLHCPHCRSEQLVAVSESLQSGGLATTNRVTRNASVTTYSTNTVNRHYWLCRDCGHKFRNLEDLTAELNRNKKTAQTSRMWTLILGVALVILMISAILTLVQGNFLGLLMLVVALIVGIAFGIALGLMLKSMSAIKKLTPEKANLEQRCFD